MEGPWELEGRTCLARLGKQTPLNNLAIRVAVNVWLLNDTSAASALAPIGDIADWDTSGATDMSDLFNCNRAGVRTDACTAFNANISAWQTAGVTNLERAFKNAAKFNQPLGPWQTAAVTSMRGLFDGAAAFDQGVNMWSTAKVVDIGTMFSGAEAFDQAVGDWNITRVKVLGGAFRATAALSSCSKSMTGAGWRSQKGVDMELLRQVFYDSWDAHALECLSRTTVLDDANVRFVVGVWLLGNSERIDVLVKNIGDIDYWEMGNVTDLADLFNCETYSGVQRAGCLVFDRQLGNWDVSSATSLRNTFRGALKFNQNIGNWRVDKVADMSGMFADASDFDQSLAVWSVASVTDFTGTFNFVRGLGSCNRRALTDAPSWKDNRVFKTSDFMSEWKNLRSCASWKFVAALPRERLYTGSEYHNYDDKGIGYVTNKPYKIAPPKADKLKTKVTNGEVSDLKYILEKGDADFFVDTQTGVVFGKFLTSRNYTMVVKAVDLGDKAAVVEEYTFEVNDVRVFRVKPDTTQPRSRVGGEYTNYVYGGSIASYYVGSSYKIAPMRIDRSPNATQVSAGTISNITYRLDQDVATDWFVNSNTGVVFGTFTAPSAAGQKFGMRLLAVDAGGQTAVLEAYAFRVLQCRTDKNEVWLDGLCQKCSAGSAPLEADPTRCALEELASCPTAAAARAADADDQCTCEGAPNPLASCTCESLDVLASMVHVHCSGSRTLPDAFPMQTTQLRLSGLEEGTCPLTLMHETAALAATGSDPLRPIVVILDTASAVVVKPDPIKEASSASSSSTAVDGTGPGQPFIPPADDAKLCLGSSNTSTPSRVHAVVCSEASGCGAGNYTKPCSKGSFAPPDGSDCQPCDRGGFYQAEPGNIGWFSHCACSKCKNGTYSDTVGAFNPVDDCLVCPSGTNTSVQAGYRACPCLADSSRTDRFGECTSCLGQEGIQCSSDFRMAAPGYHWTFADAIKLEAYQTFVLNLAKSYDYNRSITRFNGTLPPAYKCPIKDACLGGMDAKCKNGTTGPLCAVCDIGHFPLSGDCHKCPPRAAAVASGTVIVGLMVLLVAVAVHFNVMSMSSKLEALEVRAERAALGRDRDTDETKRHGDAANDTPWYTCSWLTLSKITFGHAQILSLIPTVYTAVDWPSSFRAVASGVQVVSANPFAISMPRCVSESLAVDGYAALRVAIAFPTVGSGAIGIYFLYKRSVSVPESVYCKRHTCKDERCASPKRTGHDYCGGHRKPCVHQGKTESNTNHTRDVTLCAYVSPNPARGPCPRPRTVTYARMIKAVCISTAALLFYSIYPILTVNSVRILASCHELCTNEELTECTAYMRSDYRLMCDSQAHTSHRAVAWLVFAVVSIATPLALAFVLHRNRDRFLNKNETQTPSALTLGLGFFFRPFRPGLIFWETVDLFRKLFITSLVVFIGPGTPLQLYAGILFSGTFWLVDAFEAPYENAAENLLQVLFGGALFATLVFGGMRQAGRDGVADVDNSAIDAWIMVVNVVALMAAVVLVVLNARNARATAANQKKNDSRVDEPLGNVQSARATQPAHAAAASAAAATATQRGKHDDLDFYTVESELGSVASQIEMRASQRASGKNKAFVAASLAGFGPTDATVYESTEHLDEPTPAVNAVAISFQVKRDPDAETHRQRTGRSRKKSNGKGARARANVQAEHEPENTETGCLTLNPMFKENPGQLGRSDSCA